MSACNVLGHGIATVALLISCACNLLAPHVATCMPCKLHHVILMTSVQVWVHGVYANHYHCTGHADRDIAHLVSEVSRLKRFGYYSILYRKFLFLEWRQFAFVSNKKCQSNLNFVCTWCNRCEGHKSNRDPKATTSCRQGKESGGNFCSTPCSSFGQG